MVSVFGGIAFGGIMGLARTHGLARHEPYAGLERREDLVRVPVDLDLGPHLRDLSLLVDEERRPLDPGVLAAVELLLLPDAVRLRDRARIVTEEGEVQIVLVAELPMARVVVAAHTEDDRPFRRHARQVVTEATGLCRASRRVVLGIEVQHDLLPAKILQRDRSSVVREQLEIRRLASDLRRWDHPGVPKRPHDLTTTAFARARKRHRCGMLSTTRISDKISGPRNLNRVSQVCRPNSPTGVRTR